MPERVTDAEAEALLHDLVAIPSLSTQEAEASRFLAEWLSAHGFDARVDEAGSAVGLRGDGPREVVLLGHIDTVPGEIPVRTEDGRLYGRGTVDAKGPLVAFAVAATRVEPPPGMRWVVIGATEEESATSRGARHVLTQFSPDFCIIGEPSGWDRVTLGYKGRLLVEWMWRGPLAHSAGPVPSPAERAVCFWHAVEDYARGYNEGRQASFNTIDTSLRSLNTSTDGTHGSAVMNISLRLPPDLQPSEAEAALRQINTAGRTKFRGPEPAYLASKAGPLPAAFLRAIRAARGEPRFLTKTGTSDMNVVGPVWNCPIVAFGPGDSALDHTPDEHIELEEFHHAIGVLESVLTAIERYSFHVIQGCIST